MAIRTVIFDIDDTMYNYTDGNRRALANVSEYCHINLGITEDVFRQIHQKANQEMIQRLGVNSASIHNRLVRYQRILELLDKPIFPHAIAMNRLYWETVMRYMSPEPGLSAFLADIKKRGLIIGVGTNMTADLQYKKLECLQVTPWIDWIVTSEEAGVEKPDPLFYQLCVEKAGCPAGQCLFIGDGLAGDVKGPLKYGMSALWYCPPGEMRKAADQEVRVITSFFDCVRDDFWDFDL